MVYISHVPLIYAHTLKCVTVLLLFSIANLHVHQRFGEDYVYMYVLYLTAYKEMAKCFIGNNYNSR